MTDTELKPCPFCGTEPKTRIDDGRHYVVYCPSDHKVLGGQIEMSNKNDGHDPQTIWDETFAAWNTRS